jgi:uncharacterized protein
VKRKGNVRAGYWIEKLGLESHPEGGYFRQTYAANLRLPLQALPDGFSGPRAASTAIYFLLEGKNFSAFHRLRSDEMWHFYAGRPLAVHVIDPQADYSMIQLGINLEAGQVPQAVVKAGCWFASELADASRPPAKSAGRVGQPSWALVGCTVAPGFDFEDFELAKREELAREYPPHRDLIERLTRA